MSAGAAAESEAQRSLIRADDLRRRAERLEQRAGKFQAGAVGEQLVAQALQRLTTVGYRVIDDIRWPGTTNANIDHVIYGRTGMFVVDAKNWTGKITVKAGVLRQNGYSRVRETDKVTDMTDCLQDHLGPSVGSLTPVLCLAGQNDIDAVWCGRTLVVGLDRLAPWIFRQREIWPATHAEALAIWLPHVLESATTPTARARTTPTQTATPEPERRGRHQAD
jgi:hypothetical protein